MRDKIWLIIIVGVLLLTACRPEQTSVIDQGLLPRATAVSTPTLKSKSATEIPSPTAVPTENANSPTATQPLLSPVVKSREERFAAKLATAVPPERDDVRLAIAYRGLSTEPDETAPLVSQPLEVGTVQTFIIPDVVNNTVSQIDAQLLGVSEHAYFWFDTGPGSWQPGQTALNAAQTGFDDIYEDVRAQFGSENSPGIDGDPRLFIVHASPIALCGVAENELDNCGLFGLVNSPDLSAAAVDGRSNEHEMFIMNVRRFDSPRYLGVLAHEFRHMIESNYGSAGADWEKEGSATLASELQGLPSSGPDRGNAFLQNPDQQLNSWTEGNTAPYYGQGYLLNRYILDQLGQDFYRDFAVHPAAGLSAIDAVAAARGLDVTGEALWLDWLAALALNNNPQAAPIYQFGGDTLATAVATPATTSANPLSTTVGQYAADYYELPDTPVRVTFSGNTAVPLLGTAPYNGDAFWYAQRANYSNPRLTREVDLRDVASATLQYAVYADIEYGFDFAYVSVSTDNGRTWQPLTATNMQGLDPLDNPSGAALAERFYTGRKQTWQQETIDLTSYAGAQILLRFEYVTDPILTYGGFAIDDIAIPEIGFFDGAEEEQPGWLTEGFLPATAQLPQNWHLQLITYEAGVPQVTYFAADGAEELTLRVDGGNDEQRPLLIIAATAPETLQPANYRLTVYE